MREELVHAPDRVVGRCPVSWERAVGSPIYHAFELYEPGRVANRPECRGLVRDRALGWMVWVGERVPGDLCPKCADAMGVPDPAKAGPPGGPVAGDPDGDAAMPDVWILFSEAGSIVGFERADLEYPPREDYTRRSRYEPVLQCMAQCEQAREEGEQRGLERAELACLGRGCRECEKAIRALGTTAP